MKKFSGRKACFGDMISIKPPMKGGHRHNHIYNVCHRITFRSKSARHRVSREDNSFFRATLYTSLMHNLVTLGDILKRRKHDEL